VTRTPIDDPRREALATAPASLVIAPGPVARTVILAPLSAIYRLLLWIVGRFRDPLATRIVSAVARLALVLVCGQRGLNLRRLFPASTRRERAELGRRGARHLALCIVEAARLSAMTREDLCRRVTFLGEDLLQAALARGRGVLLIGTHVGDFMVTLTFLAARGYPLSVVAYEVPIASIAEHMWHLWRRFGVRATRLGGGAAQNALSALAAGEIFATYPDVTLRPARGAWFRFGPTAINIDTGPARLSRLTDATVMRVKCHLEPDGRRVVEIAPCQDLASVGHDPIELTQAWTNDLLEEVRRRPEQWHMMSLQFLRRPDGVPLAPGSAGAATPRTSDA
jgi:KDO2-lipid IV(A) lauroyltransferase